jgi:hypothetical protein
MQTEAAASSHGLQYIIKCAVWQVWRICDTRRKLAYVNMVKVKVKVKFTLEQAMKSQMGSKGMALLFHYPWR